MTGRFSIYLVTIIFKIVQLLLLLLNKILQNEKWQRKEGEGFFSRIFIVNNLRLFELHNPSVNAEEHVQLLLAVVHISEFLFDTVEFVHELDLIRWGSDENTRE